MQMIKAYGDTLNDGQVQLSFTLPLKTSAVSNEAARLYVLKLGFISCDIVHSHPLADNFTFFVAYGRSDVSVDYTKIPEISPVEKVMNFDEINSFIKNKIGRKIIIVGACTGSDAHTVGIDAIMNMKGCNHHFGLERYPMIEAHNLGAQVPNEKLMEYAVKTDADAVLVSQVVTQKDVHIENLTELIELMEADNIRDNFIVCAGGPRISNKLALELGYEAGFGRGTYAEDVASFIAEKLFRLSLP